MASDVTEKVKQHFASYPLRSYPKGQILIFGGEDPEYIFYLAKGKVRQYDISYRGDEIVVNVFQAPAFFPMSWAINKIPNRYFFKTEVDCEMHIAPPDQALDFVKANPDVLLDLLARVYRGADGLLGRIVHLMSGSAKSRLLYELIIECRRFSNKNSDGNYLITINEGDLASRAGLSRETISREMNKIKKEGLVSIDKQGIVVKDLAAIEKKIGYEI